MEKSQLLDTMFKELVTDTIINLNVIVTNFFEIKKKK